MAIISTETKASAASSGNNKGLRFNLSNQLETYQGLAEDGNALLIKAEQLMVHHCICISTDFVPRSHLYSTTQQLPENTQLHSNALHSKTNILFNVSSSTSSNCLPSICLPYAHWNHPELKLQLGRFIARKFKIMISLSAVWLDVTEGTLFLRLPSSQTSTSISGGAPCICWQHWDKCEYFDTVWYQKTGYLHEKPVPLSPRRALLQEDISNAIKCAKHLLW